jgi:hypothetical protein
LGRRDDAERPFSQPRRKHTRATFDRRAILHYRFRMALALSDADLVALITLLRETIAADRLPHSPRVRSPRGMRGRGLETFP